MRAQRATDHAVPATRAGFAGPSGREALMAALRLFDLVFLAIAVPLALARGAPVLGCLVGAGGWLLQRALAVVDRRLIAKAAEPGSRLGLNFIDAVGREGRSGERCRRGSADRARSGRSTARREAGHEQSTKDRLCGPRRVARRDRAVRSPVRPHRAQGTRRRLQRLLAG